MGEDLGEGFARRVRINESTTLSPSPLPLTKRLSIVLFGRVSARGVSAFTLAEVLITLVIIGVIAAITVPTLITKYQKEQTVTRLKKAYSALAQTTQRAIADNGPMNSWEYTSNYNFAEKYFFPYLNVTEKCLENNTIKTKGVCAFKFSYLNPNIEKDELQNNYYRFILSDGALVAFACYQSTEALGNICGIMIDINGIKSPNIYGRDIFRYTYFVKPGTTDYATTYNGRIVPSCVESSRESLISNSSASCNKNAPERAGQCCSALIMKDGWQIKDDYPW